MSQHLSRLRALCVSLATIFVVTSPTPSFAKVYELCDAALWFDAKPRDWRELPGVESTDLPPSFVRAIERNPLVRAAVARYRGGENLCFDLTGNDQGVKSGWGIQTRFMSQVLAHVFPRAKIASPDARGCVSVPLTLFDSVLEDRRHPGQIDIINLKPVNPGPHLPATAAVRATMNLPAGAKIVSLYTSYTHAPFAIDVATTLLRRNLADIIIWSSQNGTAPSDGEIRRLAERGVTYLPSDAWAKLERPPTGPTLIFNQTRARLPFVHRAADLVVVMGLANGAEPLHAGKPTYLTKIAPAGTNQRRWSEVIADLRQTGGLHAFGEPGELPALIKKTRHRAPRSALHEDPRFLNRLVRELIGAVEDRLR